jgi:hypothetical protein
MSEKFLDPVVAEVHRARAAMLEAAGGHITELMQQVAARQWQSGALKVSGISSAENLIRLAGSSVDSREFS